MKSLVSVFVLVALTIASAGCGYLSDRGRDVADVFTLTIGGGLGGTARVGPVHTGLFLGADVAGVRGGGVDAIEGESVDLLLGFPGPEGWYFASDEFAVASDDSIVRDRAKKYDAMGVCPFIMVPSDPGQGPPRYVVPNYHGKYPYYYWTQMEVIFGLGVSVRAGLNPGEVVDFVLGWFCIDIYTDDLSRISKEPIGDRMNDLPREKPGS